MSSDTAVAAQRPAKGQVVQSLTRALNLMTILGSAGGPMSLTALAEAATLSPSTAHRLLTTLQQERYVRFDPGTRGWAVGVQAYVTGANFLKTRNLAEVAKPRMRSLMEQSSEIVSLAVEENGEAIYLTRVAGRRMATTNIPLEDRTLMHCSAVGKAMLSGMPETQVRSILAERGMRQFTRTTVSSLPALEEELTLTRSRGYAVDREERVAGMCCVGAPIYDENARPMGALSLSGPNRRMEANRLAELGELVRRAAASVTTDLGGCVPA